MNSAMACNQGQRSASVSATPAAIFATFSGGWNQSPSTNSTAKRSANAIAIVDLPDPDTPITMSTNGDSGCSTLADIIAKPPERSRSRRGSLIEEPKSLANRPHLCGGKRWIIGTHPCDNVPLAGAGDQKRDI